MHAYIEQLRLSRLRPRGRLPRVSPQLVEVIRTHGVVRPVVVRRRDEERYEIVANLESWMAAQQVPLERVPIHVLDDLSDDEVEEILAAEWAGYDSDPIDEARFFRHRLAATHPKEGERYAGVGKLADVTGYSRPYISHALRLLTLPQRVQSLIQNGRLSAGHGRALASLNDRRTQVLLAEHSMMRRLSVRALEARVRALKSGAAGPVGTSTTAPAAVDPNIRHLEQRIGDALGCSATLVVDQAELTIRYHSLDVLDGVLERLGVQVE